MMSLSRRVVPVQCNMIGLRFKDLKLTSPKVPTRVDRTFIIGPNVRYIEYCDEERRMSIVYANGAYDDLYDDENTVSIKNTYTKLVQWVDIVEHNDFCEDICKID